MNRFGGKSKPKTTYATICQQFRGVPPPPVLARLGAGGRYFHDTAVKYERHNEIHVIVICHTESKYHV